MGSNPHRAGRRDVRGRDRPPGWADAVFAGRSRADREAEQDMMVRGILVVGGVVALLLLGLHALSAAVGLQFGWWSAPAFAPLFAWLLVSAVMRRCLRPVELDGLRRRERLAGAALLMFLLWVLWPLWAGQTARAWHEVHGGFGSLARTGAPSFPLHAVLSASPVAMGLVAFVLLALGMVLAPNVLRREREWPAPPAGPEPLRAPLVSSQRPKHPNWP